MPQIEVKARSKSEAMRVVRRIVSILHDKIPDKAVPSRYLVTYHKRKVKLKIN